jgi:cytochrome P450
MSQAELQGRPTLEEFKPFSPEQLADPYPLLARARAEQPVFYAPDFDIWVVTRYDDVNRIYGEPLLYSSASVLSPRMDKPDEIQREFGDRELALKHQLVMTDPPRHSRLKKLMTPAFMPRRIMEREPWIRQLTNRLVDQFEALGSTNLVRSYAAIIPTAVVGKVIGAPEDDARHFAGWVEDIFTLTGAWDASEERRVAAWRGVFAFEDYVRQLIADRRKHPQDDLTTDFIQAQTDDGSPAMSDIEVVHNVFNVAAAGADTTGVLIAQLTHLLLSHPDQWEAARVDPSLVQNGVDEAMRVRSPVRGLMRKTTAEVTIAGVTIPEGAFVFIHLASANHDESVFVEPDRFDIRRANAKRNLGFGSRTHACIGAGLARLEAQVAVETLIERLPSLKLVKGSEFLSYRPNLVLPSIEFLEVQW